MSWRHLLSGSLDATLLVSALACFLLRHRRTPAAARAAIVPLAGVLVFLPLGDALVLEYVRGVIGELSMTGKILLATTVAACVSQREMIDHRNFGAIMTATALAAVLLYPMALGLTYFDPYAAGFSSPYFAVALLMVTLAAWYASYVWLVVCILLAIAGYLAGVLESDNLWDYLIDPLVAIYALGWTLARLARRMSRYLALKQAKPSRAESAGSTSSLLTPNEGTRNR